MNPRGKSFLLATPCYSGWLHNEYVKSLLETHACCAALGIHIQTLFLSGCARITRARNDIVRYYLNSDADYLLMVDADIGWPADAPARLMAHDLPVVAATTVNRGSEQMCIRNLDPYSSDFDYDADRGLLRVGAVGTGFLMLRRDCLDAMIRSYPNLRISDPSGGQPGYALFHELLTAEGADPGEDYSGSERIRAIGIELYVDPHIPLIHPVEKLHRQSLAVELKLPPVASPIAPIVSEIAEAAD